ncbi:DinB family protein [Sporosarcina sp. Marseille-Q4063]|uniref:DinB family protein n=1 Tax=Sporosarcina sp. Marseille-Q4063 TaxID=2810514 RepID=UPI001BB05D42|nr:DinB family protein [Sporosarcina sp. Marseille-Q4063]QUW23173.1 DinB family protein [Sporosarcina sp. Marseille-Q4063]
MFKTIDEFLNLWEHESGSTLKILSALTDESLAQEVSPEDRTLGRIAWHIVQTLHEMMSQTGLEFKGTPEDAPVPETAAEIADAYRSTNEAMVSAMKSQWNDEVLSEMRDMYGEQWSVGTVLGILTAHETHHRGQMTVLMRQAGLRVPGVYGPAREEWAAFGGEAPVI